jgi:uncharacterized protein with PQ loop repeat
MFAYIVSILAPLVNTIQQMPQLYKTFTTKRVKDLSVYSLLLVLTTNLLWLLHGYFIWDASLIVAGVISLGVNGALLIGYFMYV